MWLSQKGTWKRGIWQHGHEYYNGQGREATFSKEKEVNWIRRKLREMYCLHVKY